jgi:2-amino-4-hydroxy-6-hydroxymethyldihydropteridine diphosphokinase
MTARAYIGIGSNLDNPVAQVRAAIDCLAHIPQTRLQQASPLYRNPPMGPADQPDYVNAVGAIDTALAPSILLSELQALEADAGRQRNGQRWGPRPLDLDILLYADLRQATPTLTIPHPGLPSRAFVLYPLADIAPGLDVPGHGPLASLLDGVDAATLALVDEGAHG